MPISSASFGQVYDAPDPILENDLELMAKVNTFQQAKFDQGSKELQNEVDKWSMLSNIAKPELRDYANQKLNSLVSGINGLGGINLSNPNNVNSLKSLGYNLYGDQRIVNGVATTKKMQALSSSIQTNLSGKDASKYDPILGEYLMKGYSQWANDGDIDSKYDGPASLPQGNMTQINKKVSDYLKQLKPDADKFDVGVDPKSLGYFQVDNKWLSQSRIAEAISAVTDENDQTIFRAHGWKGLQGYSDTELALLHAKTYDHTNATISNDIKRLELELGQTKDANKKIELQNIISEKTDAVKRNETEKNSFVSKKQLTSNEREFIQQAVYSNAWKDNVINANAYTQESKVLKLNPVTAFSSKEERLSKEFAATYNLNVKKFAWDMEKDKADLSLKERELIMKENAAIGNPLNIFGNTAAGLSIATPNKSTDGTNELVNPEPVIENFKTSYLATHTQYYQKLYNILGQQDPTKFNYDAKTQMYTPKPEFSKNVDEQLNLFENKLSNYSNLTDEEKKSLHIPVDADELNELFQMKRNNSVATAYYNMAKSKEDEIVRHGLTTNAIDFDLRTRKIKLAPEYGGVKTYEEAMAIYNSLSPDEQAKMKKSTINANPVKDNSLMGKFNEWNTRVSFKSIVEDYNKFHSKLKTSYEKVGGKIFNSYDVVIPFKKLSSDNQDLFKRELITAVPELKGYDLPTLDPLAGSIELDGKTGKVKYMLNVQAGSGKKLATQRVDVTNIVANGNNSIVSQLFPKSDLSLVFGMYLANDGSTPFSAADNYKSSLHTTMGNYPYQIIRGGSQGGTEFYKVRLMYPIGNGRTIPVDVKNATTKDNSYRFEPYLEGINEYLDQMFSTPENVKKFKQLHNLK